MTIDITLKTQLKEQRLKALQAQYFEFEMTAIALDANGRSSEEVRKRMAETEISYQAVLDIVIE